MRLDLRNKRIDLIRGLSITLVLLHHFNIAYRLNDTFLSRVIGWEALRAVARNGNYGVTMFFVVSGFLITSNADRRWGGLHNVDARQFYVLRATRIIPGLLLLLLVVNLLAMADIPIFQNQSKAGGPLSFWLVNLACLTFWMNVLVIQEGWLNYPLGVLWSLSVEGIFYLAFPLLCLLLRRERLLAIFWIAIILAGPLYRLNHQGDDEGYLYAYLASFDGIAIGSCAALAARNVSLQNCMASLLRIAVAAVMAFLYLNWPIAEANVFGVTVMALGTAFLLLGTDHLTYGPTQPSRLGMLRWLGRSSYELYLFHLIVLGTMRTLIPSPTASGNEKLLLLAAFFLLSASVSTIVRHLYCEPLSRILRRRFSF